MAQAAPALIAAAGSYLSAREAKKAAKRGGQVLIPGDLRDARKAGAAFSRTAFNTGLNHPLLRQFVQRAQEMLGPGGDLSGSYDDSRLAQRTSDFLANLSEARYPIFQRELRDSLQGNTVNLGGQAGQRYSTDLLRANRDTTERSYGRYQASIANLAPNVLQSFLGDDASRRSSLLGLGGLALNQAQIPLQIAAQVATGGVGGTAGYPPSASPLGSALGAYANYATISPLIRALNQPTSTPANAYPTPPPSYGLDVLGVPNV